MHPLDDVVADVHRVRIFRQQPHLECILVTGRLECLVPPGGTLHQRRANRLGCTAIDVVDDRLDRFTDVRGRILFFKPVPSPESNL